MEGDRYRQLMGAWATGVTLVTTDGPNGPAGCTANAVSSLSLDPPLLLVCFDLTSRTLDAVRQSGRFGVSVLAASQEHVARAFATKRSMGEKFDDIGWSLESGVPVVEGALARIVCELDAVVPGGDHVIAIGRCVEGAYEEDAEPLLFYRSRFVTITPTERSRSNGGRAPL